MADRKKSSRTKKQLKTESLRMRVTLEDKELIGKLTESMEEPSDTQTIIRLVREKARERGLLD